ncbi:MAG: aminotransferase class V-fold PLP-dependent enzyme [Candidatus Aminicenantes bacterium]|nr:aminotransferase class V-fold PLP-dependent enzyme [Candidatus Aminicenantes bacterium]
MSISRRKFLGSFVAIPAVGALAPDVLMQSGDDPLGVRRDFVIPADKTYLNSAYIALCPLSVVRIGCQFLEAKGGNPYTLGAMVEKTEEVRRQFAGFVGASADEIGFISSTSEGENIVVNSLDFNSSDNVVIDDLHYATTFAVYKHLEATKGVELRIAANREGRVSLEDFAALIDRKTRLVSVAWVSHQNGFRQDLKTLAALAHERGAYVYTDAIQAVGMFPMDLRETGVDFLASGTYKWLVAGFGVAPFFVRKDLLDRIRPDRRGHLHIAKDLGNHRYEIYETAKKFEYATLSFVSIYQLGASLSYLERVGVDRIEAHTVGLARKLRKGLADLGFRLFTPEGNASSIVTFFSPKPYHEAVKIFEAAKVEVSFRGENRSHVRVSPALFNTAGDIDRFLNVAEQLI